MHHCKFFSVFPLSNGPPTNLRWINNDHFHTMCEGKERVFQLEFFYLKVTPREVSSKKPERNTTKATFCAPEKQFAI